MLVTFTFSLNEHSYFPDITDKKRKINSFRNASYENKVFECVKIDRDLNNGCLKVWTEK